MTKNTETADSIHIQPSTTDTCGRSVPGRFDTVLVNDGTGGDTGIEGKHLHLYAMGRHIDSSYYHRLSCWSCSSGFLNTRKGPRSHI